MSKRKKQNSNMTKNKRRRAGDSGRVHRRQAKQTAWRLSAAASLAAKRGGVRRSGLARPERRRRVSLSVIKRSWRLSSAHGAAHQRRARDALAPLAYNIKAWLARRLDGRAFYRYDYLHFFLFARTYRWCENTTSEMAWRENSWQTFGTSIESAVWEKEKAVLTAASAAGGRLKGGNVGVGDGRLCY
jgi:hypothetical protein